MKAGSWFLVCVAVGGLAVGVWSSMALAAEREAKEREDRKRAQRTALFERLAEEREDQLTDAATRLDNLAGELDHWRNEAERVANDLLSITSLKDELTTQLGTAEQAMATLEETHQAAAAAAARQIEDFERRLGEAETLVTSLRSDGEAALANAQAEGQAALDAATARVSELETQVTGLVARSEQLDTQLTAATESVTAAGEQIATLTTQRDELTALANQRNAMISELSNERDALQQQIANLDTQISELQTTVAGLTAALEASQRDGNGIDLGSLLGLGGSGDGRTDGSADASTTGNDTPAP